MGTVAQEDFGISIAGAKHSDESTAIYE